MREYAAEGDLMVAEIKNVSFADKTLALHIRHEKFGKLERGVLVAVNSCLIRRMKNHFVERHEIEFIFGLNGFVWLSPKAKAFDPSILETMAKFRNIIVILSENFVSIVPDLIFDVYAMTAAYAAKDLTLGENKAKVFEFVRQSIEARNN